MRRIFFYSVKHRSGALPIFQGKCAQPPEEKGKQKASWWKTTTETGNDSVELCARADLLEEKQVRDLLLEKWLEMWMPTDQKKCLRKDKISILSYLLIKATS